MFEVICLTDLKQNVHYVRYIDDWVILTKTRSKLRKLVKLTRKIMADLKITLNPEKTLLAESGKSWFFGVPFYLKRFTVIMFNNTAFSG